MCPQWSLYLFSILAVSEHLSLFVVVFSMVLQINQCLREGIKRCGHFHDFCHLASFFCNCILHMYMKRILNLSKISLLSDIIISVDVSATKVNLPRAF